MNSINNSISVVIPVYNSKSTLDKLIKRLQSVLSCFDKYEIILINDNSADNSFEIIKNYANKNKKIIAINLLENVGQQLATFLGLKYANNDYTVIIDDDLAQNPEDIIRLYEEIIKGYDVVYGIKKQKANNSIIRNLGSKIRDMLFNIVTQKPKDIKVSSFRIMNREIREKIITANTKFIYISMEILKHTNNIGNIYVDYTTGSISNYNLKKLISLITKMYVYYSNQGVFKTEALPNDIYKIGEIINGEKI